MENICIENLPKVKQVLPVNEVVNKLIEFGCVFNRQKITTAEAAEIMCVSPRFVRKGLQDGILPFGEALNTNKHNWVYHINPSSFYYWVGNGDKVLPTEVAKRLQMRPEYVRAMIKQGKFDFGWAVQLSENTFTYYISRKAFDRYLKRSNEENDL